MSFCIVYIYCLQKACTDVERDFSTVEIGKKHCCSNNLVAKKKLLRCNWYWAERLRS